MIENANNSKTAGEFVDSKKYTGVASVSILAINPDNAKLRSFGWNIPADAPEPEYTKDVVGEDGSVSRRARVRFMVQIQDLEEKPIVPLDFWIRPDATFNAGKTKGKIIDAFGRTAWGTKEEIKAGKVPTYASGPASISQQYNLCHVGEEELVTFLMKFLNITPLQVFQNGQFVPSKNPGKLTIDNWAKLCSGDVNELISYVALQPDNKVKVIFGVQTGDDNKTFQTFMKSVYIGNGVGPDRGTGEYGRARKAIDKLKEEEAKRKQQNPDFSSNVLFDAKPVHEYVIAPSSVSENNTADDDDLPEDTASDNDFPWEN